VFNVLSVNGHQPTLPTNKKKVFNALAAIVNVISLKCVLHKTKPPNITNCVIKKQKTPDFQAFSCSILF